uniref:Sulfotransferase n=1 Tax=Astyanax mexicanus TaxID=7994 RepID=A0A8B9RIL3_ASTMX
MDHPRPELFDFHGVSMTHYFTDNWENVQNFKARPDDIVVATYPKAGTTWLCYILDLLYFCQTHPDRETTVPIYERVPFLEMTMPSYPLGLKETYNTLTTSPRIIKTHLPVQFLPKSFWEQNCKVQLLCPSFCSSKTSLYYSNSNLHCVVVLVVFGSWFDHVCGWWEKKQTYSNIHYMFFEDMVEDTGREIKHLCSFLGLSTSEEEKEKIRGDVQFDVMKANPMTNLSEDGSLDFSVSQFLRKGKVGDWKNHFTVAQNEQFDELYKQKMKNTTLQFRTEI